VLILCECIVLFMLCRQQTQSSSEACWSRWSVSTSCWVR